MAKKMKNVLPKGDFVEEMSEDLDTFETWFVEHWRLVVAIGFLIIFGIGAFAAYKYISANQIKYRQARFSNAVTEQEIRQAIADFPNSEAVDAAYLRLAALFLSNEKFDDAQEALKKVASSPGADVFLRTRAMLDNAYISEKRGNKEEAIRDFETISSNMVLAAEQHAEGTYSAGRLYAQAGQYDKARSLLSLLNAQGQGNNAYAFWAEQAAFLLARLPVAERQLTIEIPPEDVNKSVDESAIEQ